MKITYINKKFFKIGAEEIFSLGKRFFTSINETQIDYEKGKIFFKGDNVHDNPRPIPDPILAEGFPLWAIILISIVGVIGVGALIKFFLNKKKKKELE